MNQFEYELSWLDYTLGLFVIDADERDYRNQHGLSVEVTRTLIVHKRQVLQSLAECEILVPKFETMRYWCATVHAASSIPDDPTSNGYFKGFGLTGMREAIEYLADSQDLSRRMIRELRKNGISYFNSYPRDPYLCEVDEISELDYMENCDQDD